MRMKRIFVKETLKYIPLLECEKAPRSLVERSYGSIEKRISGGDGEKGLREKNLERGQQVVHRVKCLPGKPEDPSLNLGTHRNTEGGKRPHKAVI